MAHSVQQDQALSFPPSPRIQPADQCKEFERPPAFGVCLSYLACENLITIVVEGVRN